MGVTKAQLRERLSDRHQRVQPDEARQAAERVRDQVLQLPELAAASGVLICLSFGQELDTWQLVEHLLQAGKDVHVPRALPQGPLSVHRYPCELRKLSFGLQQPPRSATPVAADQVNEVIDVAFLLGLGFDRAGYRLGYGAGHFDRFLAGRPFPGIGLGYDFQMVDTLPSEPHDIPMAKVVTDCGVYTAS